MRIAFVLSIALLMSIAPAGTQSSPAGGAVQCPRCGYRVDPAWQHCVACGWDLRRLAGTGGAARLQAIGVSTAGVIVVKEPPNMDEILSPRLLRATGRFAFLYRPGRNKFFATAFPFLKPGLFVTSARVLEWVEMGDLRTYNNRMVPAEILGYDLPSGIGVFKADVPGAAPMKVSGIPPREGDTAWAICFPVLRSGRRVEYLPESFHRGRITAVGQQGTNLVSFENFLRTDHSIEDGCLGGAVLDAYGDLAGMILDSPDPGVVYSVPAGDLAGVVEVLSGKRTPERPYFGIGLTPPDERRRAKFRLPAESLSPVVAYLIPGSPADTGGMRPGDLLAAVDGEKTSNVSAAGRRLLAAAPGGPAVRVTVQRAGQEVSLSVAPGRRPRRVLLAPSDEMEEALQANLVEIVDGPTSQQGLRIANLVRGGRGEKWGYFDGDVIVMVQGKGVRRRETLDRIVRDENSHIFGESGSEAGPSRLSTYRIRLAIRDARKEEKVDSTYTNLFPDVLSAPVY